MPPLGLNRPREAFRLRKSILGVEDRETASLREVALMFGVSAGQGYVPAIEPTDHDLPAIEPDAGASATR
jgi:hypothetical protein